MDNQKKINKFMNDLWQFIKRNAEVPDQNDLDAWDRVTFEASELTKGFNPDDPAEKLFIDWTVDYLEYMNRINKSRMGLMAEVRKVLPQVMANKGE